MGDYGHDAKAKYLVGLNCGICQECMETIKAYEPPKPRYSLNFHDWAHGPRQVTVYDVRERMDIGWFTEREAIAVCDLLNRMEQRDE